MDIKRKLFNQNLFFIPATFTGLIVLPFCVSFGGVTFTLAEGHKVSGKYEIGCCDKAFQVEHPDTAF